MELLEAMERRHSVRSYSDKKIEGEVREKLEQKIRECNKEGGLHMQLVLNEPKAFDSFMAHYGKFSGVTNYIAVVGPKGKDLEEKAGYYGEKLCLVIAVGYGAADGTAHRSKSGGEVSTAEGDVPDWFRKGVEASLLAPTAMNQQKYKLMLNGSRVSATSGSGFYTKIDLGIVKYHFEVGAGKENFTWE